MKLVELCHIKPLQFSRLIQTFVIGKEGNASGQLQTTAVLQRVSRNLSKTRTRRPIVRSGNTFSVNVMTYAWVRNFVYCLVSARLTMRLETKGIPLHYTRVNATKRKLNKRWTQYLMKLLIVVTAL